MIVYVCVFVFCPYVCTLGRCDTYKHTHILYDVYILAWRPLNFSSYSSDLAQPRGRTCKTSSCQMPLPQRPPTAARLRRWEKAREVESESERKQGRERERERERESKKESERESERERERKREREREKERKSERERERENE